jgi:hypothetical protein
LQCVARDFNRVRRLRTHLRMPLRAHSK